MNHAQRPSRRTTVFLRLSRCSGPISIRALMIFCCDSVLLHLPSLLQFLRPEPWSLRPMGSERVFCWHFAHPSALAWRRVSTQEVFYYWTCGLIRKFIYYLHYFGSKKWHNIKTKPYTTYWKWGPAPGKCADCRHPCFLSPRALPSRWCHSRARLLFLRNPFLPF